MQALAAETNTHANEAFYATPEFWVLVAFVLLFVLVGKKAMIVVTTALDDRATRIREQIETATKLREEAQDLLASYKQKQHEAEAEAARIISHAHAEAERIAADSAKALEASLKRQENQAKDRIAQAELEAVREVRAKAVDVALDATRVLLAKELSSAKSDQLINDAIKDLETKLN